MSGSVKDEAKRPKERHEEADVSDHYFHNRNL